jgi:hypothetical protein
MKWIGPLCGLLLAMSISPARADLIYQSATLGPTGQTSGGIVSDGSFPQFLGARFTIASAVEVSQIGGHIANESGDLFGAIVALSGPTAFPTGAPFSNTEVVASTDFNPGTPSSDFVTPLTATLEPGTYALVFGSGTLGATAGNGFMPTDNTDLPGASYIVWNGFTDKWSNSSVDGLRFEVYGTFVPEPSSITLAAVALALAFGFRRKRGSRCR